MNVKVTNLQMTFPNIFNFFVFLKKYNLREIWAPIARLQFLVTMFPFKTREKPGITHCCVIVNLSFPENHSVNTGLDPNTHLDSEFILTLPSVDQITEKIVRKMIIFFKN